MITERFSRRRKKRRTSSSGTGGTTIPRFMSLRCTWFCSIRTGPAMNAAIIRVKPTCSWPISPSSTRWIPRRLPGWKRFEKNILQYAPQAEIVLAESPVLVTDPDRISGKRVLVVEDGPTLTHGEMAYGAGIIAAETYGAAEIVDPRPYAVGTIRETFDRYPHIKSALPAMGYGEEQIRDLEESINNTDCDMVLFATPIHLTRILDINKPTLRVRYEYRDCEAPLLEEVLMARLREVTGSQNPK